MGENRIFMIFIQTYGSWQPVSGSDEYDSLDMTLFSKHVLFLNLS